jgi:Na+/melibiose symporter-like transporter
MGMAVWIVVQIGLFFFEEGVDPLAFYIAGALAGVGVSIGAFVTVLILSPSPHEQTELGQDSSSLGRCCPM